MRLNLWQQLLVIFALSAWNSVWALDLRINSLPSNAEVFVKSTKSDQFKKIGETPFTISFQDLVQSYTKESVFFVEIRKADHTPYRVLMADLQSSDVNLDVKLEMIDEYANLTKIDEIVQSLFDAQRLIRASSYGEALKILDAGITKFPKVSSFYELKAGVFYVQKNYKDALEFYREAFKHNPKNYDAYRMKDYLEKKLLTAETIKTSQEVTK